MYNEIINISTEEFDKMRLINNLVAVEISHRNSEEKSKSGLTIVQDPALFSAHSIESMEKYDSSQHLDRWGIVSKIPDKLSYTKKGTDSSWKMPWETDIEIQLGDEVWGVYLDLIHCPIVKTETKEYWIVNYQSLIVARRKNYFKSEPCFTKTSFKTGEIINETTYHDLIIPLNGYCLFSQINEGLQSKFLELPKEINKKKGIVRYVGSMNRSYANGNRSDDVDIKPGDEVVFRNEVEVLLENEVHQHFEKENLRYTQRINVHGVIVK